jgi:hypothetical protein
VWDCGVVSAVLCGGIAWIKPGGFIALDRGDSFAAEFDATWVKPGCRWAQAEAKSFRGALKDAPRVIPRRYRELDLEVELHDSIYRGWRG